MKNQTTNQTAEKATTDFSAANFPETFKPESETIEFVKPLKHPTQQKRVEQIEKQKWELIAATATIDNQAATINDLLARNGNLTRITNDQTERIEILQHENKNYESAIKVIENKSIAKQARVDYLSDRCDALNESRDRLASKFTNWFIFLVTISVGSIALNVYQYFN